MDFHDLGRATPSRRALLGGLTALGVGVAVPQCQS
jgi:hypothetical protein